MGNRIKHILALLPALIIYAYFAHQLNFIQDDAYISYRYVENFLNGDGLVYNIGERIEGFTNFAWVIYLILLAKLGINYILVSQITGFVFGGGVIVLTYLVAGMIFEGRNCWFVLLPTYLVGANISLAYWAQAGLETGVFAFFAMLSLYLFLKKNWFLIFSLALSVWIRPEGAVLAGILIITEAIISRRIPKFTLRCALTAFVISLPFVFFKIFYYGSIFPNPFYAKTGMRLDHLLNGLEYAGRFFSHYGFYGAGFILTLIFYKKMTPVMRTVWWFAFLYTLYIVLVGGDVLKVHRFFIPIFGPVAILAALSVLFIVMKQNHKTRYLALFFVSIPLLVLTVVLPRQFVLNYNLLERRFTIKMGKMAEKIKESDDSDFSVALATIGKFGYGLIGHDIIDMVGLTDSTIARHSEEPIEGMETTWKEAKHNTKYLLQRAPDYILFSTGIKPSAPAERALYLYREFTEAYRTIGWYFKIEETDQTGLVFSVFKKMRDIEGDFKPYYPVEYVQHYKTGLDYYVQGDYKKAIEYFNRSIKASPLPYNVAVVYQKAFCHMMMGQNSIAQPLMNAVLKRDSLVFQAHRDLYLYALIESDSTKAALHYDWLKRLVPWYVGDIDRMAALQMRQQEKKTGQEGQ